MRWMMWAPNMRCGTGPAAVVIEVEVEIYGGQEAGVLLLPGAYTRPALSST